MRIKYLQTNKYVNIFIRFRWYTNKVTGKKDHWETYMTVDDYRSNLKALASHGKSSDAESYKNLLMSDTFYTVLSNMLREAEELRRQATADVVVECPRKRPLNLSASGGTHSSSKRSKQT